MQELGKVGKNVGDRKELKVTYLEYNRDIKKGHCWTKRGYLWYRRGQINMIT